MGAMPSGFRSTTLGKMAKEENWQTSSWVMPKLSQSNVAYRDITWDPVNKQLRPRTAKSNRIFQVLSARMVPLPGSGRVWKVFFAPLILPYWTLLITLICPELGSSPATALATVLNLSDLFYLHLSVHY
ncbi:nephrocystin-1-like [Orbicella faveolata]|uniref:nephrocystin-1-like n=1 Tax=Orbicella faveolata TaxID=48498 RepID=UPI0009E199F9|nr:nephrocystin-1-like [Orbicella faveolata]